jgi:L-lactate dehydrogenase complex protein LldG
MILGRVREALKTKAPRPGHANNLHFRAPLETRGLTGLRRWLPPVGESFAEQLDLFRLNAASLKAEFYLLESQAELLRHLSALALSEKWSRIGTHAGHLTDLIRAELKLPVCRTDCPYEVAKLEKCNVAITECDALVAQTGSILLTGRSAGGRALSVLPPHHVVLAERSQLLRDLPDAFALLKQKYAPNYPSFISLITGPSRTGDIERILVLGAHGPKKLTVLCL